MAVRGLRDQPPEPRFCRLAVSSAQTALGKYCSSPPRSRRALGRADARRSDGQAVAASPASGFVPRPDLQKRLRSSARTQRDSRPGGHRASEDDRLLAIALQAEMELGEHRLVFVHELQLVAGADEDLRQLEAVLVLALELA